MTKKQEEESACERVPDESEGKPDQEQELVEEIESFNDALSEIGKTAQEATDSWDQFHRVWEQAIEAVAKKLAENGNPLKPAQIREIGETASGGDFAEDEEFRLYLDGGTFVGIYQYSPSQNLTRPVKLFLERT